MKNYTSEKKERKNNKSVLIDNRITTWATCLGAIYRIVIFNPKADNLSNYQPSMLTKVNNFLKSFIQLEVVFPELLSSYSAKPQKEAQMHKSDIATVPFPNTHSNIYSQIILQQSWVPQIITVKGFNYFVAKDSDQILLPWENSYQVYQNQFILMPKCCPWK